MLDSSKLVIGIILVIMSGLVNTKQDNTADPQMLNIAQIQETLLELIKLLIYFL